MDDENRLLFTPCSLSLSLSLSAKSLSCQSSFSKKKTSTGRTTRTGGTGFGDVKKHFIWSGGRLSTMALSSDKTTPIVSIHQQLIVP